MTESQAWELPSAPAMTEVLRGVIRRWHEVDPALDWEGVERVWPADRHALPGHIAHLGLINCFQWHLEDECRAHYGCPPVLARLKHAIDASNRRRVLTIDDIDRRIASGLDAERDDTASARPAVVTPGALIDQLSILELKRFHADARRVTDPAERTALMRQLSEQIEDLCAAIDDLVRELRAGERRLKFYRTVKLYGQA